VSRFYLVTPLTPIHVVDGAAFTTFTTFQDISPPGQLVIPQQYLEAGVEIQLEADGEFSNTGTPTLSLGFWINGAAGAAPTTILAQSSAVTTASGVTGVPWRLRWAGRIRTAGPSGSINGQGEMLLGSSVSVFNTTVPIPITKALRTVSPDLSASRAVGVGAAWGTSNAANSITTNRLLGLLVS
jgi:hypothetical protein